MLLHSMLLGNVDTSFNETWELIANKGEIWCFIELGTCVFLVDTLKSSSSEGTPLRVPLT